MKQILYDMGPRVVARESFEAESFISGEKTHKKTHKTGKKFVKSKFKDSNHFNLKIAALLVKINSASVNPISCGVGAYMPS